MWVWARVGVGVEVEELERGVGLDVYCGGACEALSRKSFFGPTLTWFGDVDRGRGLLEHEHEVEGAEEDGAHLDERERGERKHWHPVPIRQSDAGGVKSLACEV